MTSDPNFEDMSLKPFTVNKHYTINPELDPETIFLKVFLPLIQSISM